jgi:hypothetical protein
MSTEESPIAGLFVHSLRSDWGLAILSHELDGKRHYLFQDGQKRALASSFSALMKRVEAPTQEQHAAYARLRKLVGPRRQDGTTDSAAFEAQLDRLRQNFPGGLSGPKWEEEVRGSSGDKALARDAALEHARTELSREKLDALLSARHFEKVWSLVVSVLQQSTLVPATQLKLPVPNERVHDLAVALCGLLSDGGVHADRFDRFVAAYTVATGKSPSWELATAPMALLYPREHVFVELPNFRRQLKVNGSRRAIPARPSGSAYAVILAHTRQLVHKLTENGEAPRDLLEVRDFMAVTLGPVRTRKRTTT